MATVAGLRQQVRFLKRKATPVRPARHWSMCLAEGEEVSEELRREIGPNDSVFIRRIPGDILPDRPEWGQIMSCWKPGPHGTMKPHVVRQYNVDCSKV